MKKKTKFFGALVTAICVSATGFVIHVFSAETVQRWVQGQMSGRTIKPSFNVMIPAAITSIETGIGLVILYALVRKALPFKNVIIKGLAVGVLVLAISGDLIRQPLMNLFVGNPLKVVLVQDGLNWFVWIAMCIVLAVFYEWIVQKSNS